MTPKESGNSRKDRNNHLGIKNIPKVVVIECQGSQKMKELRDALVLDTKISLRLEWRVGWAKERMQLNFVEQSLPGELEPRQRSEPHETHCGLCMMKMTNDKQKCESETRTQGSQTRGNGQLTYHFHHRRQNFS
jgi:hypothetical protein